MSVVIEAKLTELSDERLKHLVGSLHETVKRREEDKKSDSVLLRMKDELKAYEDTHYNTEIKELKARLTAARKQLRVRGIVMEVAQ